MNQMEAAVREGLGPEWREITVRALEEVDSTNLRLKEAARAGIARAPSLLTADSQTSGRGRLGRTFVSPPGAGLYMSLLCSPPEGTGSGGVTILAAVAVCRAIEELTGLRPKIKWVNDLFVNGNKVCGILAEAVGRDAIVGIGVNLIAPPGGYPPEAGAAGALGAPVDRGLLAGRIARYLLDGFTRPDPDAVLDAYRARMPLTGHRVRCLRDGKEKNVLVTGVAADGGLMIRDENGHAVLRAGEVTLGSEAIAELMR